jgi:aconitate hydratase 2/2-methylisocitrate dehydratase
MGTGAQVYLGSAELGAMVALTSMLPTPDQYFAVYNERVAPHADEVYQYLQFDELGEFDAIYNRRDL